MAAQHLAALEIAFGGYSSGAYLLSRSSSRQSAEHSVFRSAGLHVSRSAGRQVFHHRQSHRVDAAIPTLPYSLLTHRHQALVAAWCLSPSAQPQPFCPTTAAVRRMGAFGRLEPIVRLSKKKALKHLLVHTDIRMPGGSVAVPSSTFPPRR